MSRELIPRGHKQKAAAQNAAISQEQQQAEQHKDIEIKAVPAVPIIAPSPNSLAAKQQNEIKTAQEKHRAQSLKYYYDNKEEVLKKLKEKRLKKQLQKAQAKEQQLKKTIEIQDKKEDNSIPQP